MDSKQYALVSAGIFLAVFVFHALRLFFGWDAVIGGVAIPAWASWIAVFVAGFLSYMGFVVAGYINKK